MPGSAVLIDLGMPESVRRFTPWPIRSDLRLEAIEFRKNRTHEPQRRGIRRSHSARQRRAVSDGSRTLVGAAMR